MSRHVVEFLRCDNCKRSVRLSNLSRSKHVWRYFTDYYGNEVHVCAEAVCVKWLEKFLHEYFPRGVIREVKV